MERDNGYEEERNYAEIVENFFNEDDWNFDAKTMEDGDIIFTLPMAAKNIPGLNIKLIVAPDGVCKIFNYLAREIPDEKCAEMLEVLNKLNLEYRYIKLTLDKDNYVIASYDFALFGNEEDTVEEVREMLFLVKNIMDKCIPPIMKLIWAD